MEYLASGTPTIMCHLPAIPEEYDDYLYYITDESVEGIRQILLEVCEKPQQILDEFGNKASTFIRDEKNAVAQAQKIINLMKETQRVKEK
jgi:glycosyltransferase involved in cell wall biosynthesis